MTKECNHATVGECSYCVDQRLYNYETLLRKCKKELKKYLTLGKPTHQDLIDMITKALK